MFKKKKKSFDFFLTDNEGNLFKATSVDNSKFVLDEEELEEKEVVKEDKPTKDEDEVLVLTPEEIAFVKQLYAEHTASQQVDEQPKSEVEEKKEEVIDTNKTKDSTTSVGSIEPQIKTNDSDTYAYQQEVANAWANRGKKKEN